MSIQYTCDRCGEITKRMEWEGKTLDVAALLDLDDEEFDEDEPEYKMSLDRRFDLCQGCCHKLEDKLRDFFYKKLKEQLRDKPKKKRVTKKGD